MFDTEILQEIYEQHSLEIAVLFLLLLGVIAFRVFQTRTSFSIRMPAASPQTVTFRPISISRSHLTKSTR